MVGIIPRLAIKQLKVTYEWFTPKGRRRTFYDFGYGDTEKSAIDFAKKNIKRRLRHEDYTVIKMEFI